MKCVWQAIWKKKRSSSACCNHTGLPWLKWPPGTVSALNERGTPIACRLRPFPFLLHLSFCIHAKSLVSLVKPKELQAKAWEMARADLKLTQTVLTAKSKGSGTKKVFFSCKHKVQSLSWSCGE